MAKKAERNSTKKSYKAVASFGPENLSPLLHSVLFAYEKLLYDTYGEEAASVLPYLVESLEKTLPKEFLKSIDASPTSSEKVRLMAEFLNSSGFFHAVRIITDKKGDVTVQIDDCSFAKQGVHDLLRPMTGNICPFAILVAALLSRSSEDKVKVMASPSKVDGNSSQTSISVSSISAPKNIPESALSELDSMDLDIIRLMRENARLSNVDIAEALKTSEATVRRRIQLLIEKGIIKGFVARIDHGKFRPKIKVYVAIDAAPSKVEVIAEKLLARNDMCAIYRSLGSFNIIAELMADDMNSAQEFMDATSRLDGVKRLESMVTTAALRPCPWYGV